MKAVLFLTNYQLERRYERYVKAGLPVPIDLQGEMIRRGYYLNLKERI